MKKSDLKNGMLVKTKDGDVGIILKEVNTIYGICDIVKFQSGFYVLDEYYDDNLQHGDDTIVEVYNTRNWGLNMDYLLSTDNYLREKHLIWKRKKVIDYKKVPKWTKVQVRNCESEDWVNRYFLGVNGNNRPYQVTRCDEYTYEDIFKTSYKCIRLHPSVEIKEEWYK